MSQGKFESAGKEALMSNRPFRFVHASDLHLEQPPWGLAEVPDHLRELLVESPYWAAERVFETALAEEADLLVLSGDVLQPARTGPRGPLFLAAQFQRLAERGISVYWAGGRVDPPASWPSYVPLPENVHVFPGGRVGTCTHQREGVPVARLMGAGRLRGRPVRPRDFGPDPEGLFSIAVVHGKADAAALQGRNVDYWALGGSHARNTLFAAPQAGHYPGSPQGRGPNETGPHGCSLVEVDAERRIRITLVPCDAVRRHNEIVLVDEKTTRNDLQRRLGDRLKTLQEAAPGIDLLISWTVSGSGEILRHLRRGTLAAELLQALRGQYGAGSPGAWSVSLAAEAAAVLPATWYDQQSIRGDYLRELRRLQIQPDVPLGIEQLLSEEQRAGPLGRAAAPADAAGRERMLREAAVLGADLLSGEGPLT